MKITKKHIFRKTYFTLKIVQMTISPHGGVVNDPLYLGKEKSKKMSKREKHGKKKI